MSQASLKATGLAAAMAALLMSAGAASAADPTEVIIVDNIEYTIAWAVGSKDNGWGDRSEQDITSTSWYGNVGTAADLATQSAQGALGNSNRGSAWFIYADAESTSSNAIKGYDTVANTGSKANSTFSDGQIVTFAYELAAPVVVPEIDGAALAKGALAIAALGLWAGAGARRRGDGEAVEVRPCV
ncbi:hypothetical protein V6X63_03370 [Spiribacter sp. 221]|uniref:hypothetical protein n=1 Tax=Spiribacter onubensis TaxID=3122420 RepID=UPI00349F4D9E